MNKMPARPVLQRHGPAVADGMLYMNSGYAHKGGLPGNVLSAFEAAKYTLHF